MGDTIMKIGVVAWVGNCALADDIIGHVTKTELQNLGHSVTFGPWQKTIPKLVNQINNLDHFVFGGGSLLCPTKIHPMSLVNGATFYGQYINMR